MSLILHLVIPGEPIAQERHRWGRGHNYDPNARDKKNFQWQVKAACPMLERQSGRLGIEIYVWSSKRPVKKRATGKMVFQTDWDNYAKFYCDALNGLAWDDDSQIEDGRVVVTRNSEDPRVKILLWKLED